MKLNLHETCRHMHCFGPAACGTTGTGLVGKTIDRKGYNGVEFLTHFGLFASTTETIPIVIMESDTGTTGTFTSVADSNLAGTEALAGIPITTGSRVSGTNKSVAKRVGYLGNKRYLLMKEVPVGTATCIVSGTCLLYAPQAAATSNP